MLDSPYYLQKIVDKFELKFKGSLQAILNLTIHFLKNLSIKKISDGWNFD